MTSRAMSLAQLCGLAATSCACAQPLAETFDSVSSLPASGWVAHNNSSPIGSMSWFQGNSATFPPQSSAGYLAADFRSVGSLGTISNWQMSPVRTLNNGDHLRFWTRTVSPAAYADRLQVRMSTSGASTNVGAAATDLGDFTTLLLDLNPTYLLEGSGSYPTGWTQFTLTLSGLPGPTQGRLAFRYFVEHAGVNGSNADCIGIDSLEYTPGGLQLGRCCVSSSGACAVITPTECAGQGGVYGGDGTTCSGFNCPPPPTGACCTAVGACSVMTTAACSAAGGIFRGENSVCSGANCPSSFAYLGTPVLIQDGIGSSTCGPTASAEVVVSANFPIGKAEAAFVIQHPWQGDLKISLVKVDGPAVTLVDRPGVPGTTYGFSGSDFGNPHATPAGYFRATDLGQTSYDTPAVAAPGIGQPVGIWKPESPLTAFFGQGSAGTWRLNVTDCAGGEYGEINAFVLILTPEAGVAGCYANCDQSTASPVLTANDFQCFLNLVAVQSPAANCDESTVEPLITANDFQCYLNKFAAGCS